MTEQNFAKAFNEWMRRYTDEPDRFSREFESVIEFLEDIKNDSDEPRYGVECAAYFMKILEEVS